MHRFLRRALVVGRAAALDEVRAEGDQAFSDLCNNIDLGPLFSIGRVVSSEMAWAYDVVSGAARTIGENRGRDYGELGATETAGTTDLEMADESGCIVVDFKTGALPHPARERAQLRVNALMVGTYEAKRMASELVNKRALGSGAMKAFLGGLGAGFGGALRHVADEALTKRAVPTVDIDALEEVAKAGGGKPVPVDAGVLQKIVDELRMRRKAVPT